MFAITQKFLYVLIVFCVFALVFAGRAAASEIPSQNTGILDNYEVNKGLETWCDASTDFVLAELEVVPWSTLSAIAPYDDMMSAGVPPMFPSSGGSCYWRTSYILRCNYTDRYCDTYYSNGSPLRTYCYPTNGDW